MPKIIAGLEILNSRLWNEASLVKLSWRMVQDSQALWSRVLSSKYGSFNLPIHNQLRASSYVWK